VPRSEYYRLQPAKRDEMTRGGELWALLPLVASQHLRLGVDGYGALFGALGVGAIIGAWMLGQVKISVSTNGILIAACVLYAAALAFVIVVPSFPAALATLVLSGLAWMAVTSTLQAELQLVLPRVGTAPRFRPASTACRVIGVRCAGGQCGGVRGPDGVRAQAPPARLGCDQRCAG
jgi:predicted MFS family arabinose efflux permease